MESYSYYDDILNEGSLIPVYRKGNHVGRNLYHSYNGESVVICHVPNFLAYSQKNWDGKMQDYSSMGFGGSAGAILAIHHWNNGNGVVVKKIEGINNTCPIRFTTEVFDTMKSPISSVKSFTELITRKPSDTTKPQPCGIMGSIYSMVSVKLALITGVYDLMQISPGASSESLENTNQYPLFSRTHPSDGGAAELLPQYLHEVMNVTKFAIVYIADDDYGTDYYEVVQDYANKHNMTLLPIPLQITLPVKKPEQEVKEKLRILKESQMNYVVGVFFRDSYELIMEAAVDIGVVGPGKFWLFFGGLVSYLYDSTVIFKKGSKLAKATYGNAVITDGGGAVGIPEYEAFVNEWKDLGYNPEKLNYVNSKQPPPPEGTDFSFNRSKEFFDLPPNHISIYSYEAIIGMGLSACQAATEHQSTFENEDSIFSGADHHDAFLDIDFISASGRVSIGKNSISREASSTYYVVANLLEESSTEEEITFKAKDHYYFDALDFSWNQFKHSPGFTYADGGRIPPQQIFGVEENKNLISRPVRAFSLTLSSIIFAVSIGFMVYIYKMRNRSLIRMSQPPFLYMISIGTSIMSVSIITLSMDDGVISDHSLDITCSSTPCFFSIGFVIIFAALFSKLWRLNKVRNCAHRCWKRKTSELVVFRFLTINYFFSR